MDEPLDRKSVARLPATVARVVLGHLLKRLRERAALSTNEAAERALLAKATLWRMEKGDIRCRVLPGDVELLAHLYQADEQRALLGDLVTAAREWRERYPHPLPDRVKQYLDLEAHATRIDWYSSHLVPDLLRTPDYVAAVVDAGLLEVHPLRRALLERSEPAAVTVRVVLDELVLHGPAAASDVMADQLAHVDEVAEFPNVSVRVLPSGGAIHAGRHTGPFVILGFPEIPGAGVLPGVAYREAGKVVASEPEVERGAGTG